uniref:Uncharacterized protein n=1 Tax=Leptobrachium leishanense TaxID=445787 RepID=A0A8C5WHD8_9ANUR
MFVFSHFRYCCSSLELWAMLDLARIPIGIFSRDDASCYEWLTRFLRSIPEVKDVRPVYISRDGLADILCEATCCDLAILYHTKNRGRINITDVTDSLYDKELELLFQVLGRQGVMVLIDDLEHGGQEDKIRILTHQPKIRTLAQDLVLITAQEKESYSGNATGSHLSHIEGMLRHLRDIIRARGKRKYLKRIFGLSLASLLSLMLACRVVPGMKPVIFNLLLQSTETQAALSKMRSPGNRAVRRFPAFLCVIRSGIQCGAILG